METTTPQNESKKKVPKPVLRANGNKGALVPGSGSLNPAGRPKGSPNKKSILTNEQRKKLAEATDGITPLYLLISIARDEDELMSTRIEAAKVAAPYLHKKMPIAIEGGDPNRPLNLDIRGLQNLGTSELSQLKQLLVKAGVQSGKDGA